MDLEWVQLRNFQTYLDLDLKLTPGLTLLVGDNGTGKSTIIEAVAWALYGETIRDSDPCVKNQLTQAAILFRHAGASYQVARNRSPRGSTTLTLSCNAVDQSGQTVTETQLRINELVGPWDRFKSTRVFAREFMARFGAASDKERKALLEGMLGLEQFDRALTITRDKLRASERAQSAAQARSTLLMTELETAGQDHGKASAASTRTSSEVRAEIAERDQRRLLLANKASTLKGLIADARKDMDAHNNEASRCRGVAEAATKRIETLQKRLSIVEQSTECPTCYRTFEGEAGKEEARKHYNGELDLAHYEKDTNEAKLQEELEMAKSCKEEMNGLDRQKQDVEAQMEGLRALRLDQELTLVEQQEKRVAELAARMTDLATRSQEAKDELAAAVKEAQVLSLAADAFGLRGARTLLLARALIRLETETNQVLQALGLPIEVAISGTTLQKSGKEVDTISVTLKGAGGGNYSGASSGERARVDVALLLALANIMGPVWGEWMAFDEVFDALDADGIDRVAAYLDSLVTNHGRQVLVVSHHVDLRSMFPRGVVLKATKDDALGSSLAIV